MAQVKELLMGKKFFTIRVVNMFGGWNKALGNPTGNQSLIHNRNNTNNNSKSPGSNSYITSPNKNGSMTVMSSGSKESSRAMSIAFNSDNLSEIDRYDKFLVSVIQI